MFTDRSARRRAQSHCGILLGARGNRLILQEQTGAVRGLSDGARQLRWPQPKAAAMSSASFCARALSAASTMMRSTGSVPEGRMSTRPALPSVFCTSFTAAAKAALPFQSYPLGMRRLRRTCGMSERSAVSSASVCRLRQLPRAPAERSQCRRPLSGSQAR